MINRMNGHKYNDVRYIVARSREDFDVANKFLKGTEFEGTKLAFPTIIATINGVVEGILGTHDSKEAIIAGPLYIKTKGLRRATLEIKLVDAYESLLINFGVKAYIFSVSKEDRNRIEMMKEIGLKPYADDKTAFWYMRKF